jgi:hypothetical protein
MEPRAPGRQLQSERGPKTEPHELARGLPPFALRQPPGRAGRGQWQCSKCGVASQPHPGTSFDTSARFECSQTTLTARISPKDEVNLCQLFAPRTTVERQTSTPAQQSPATNSAKKAFDDLFNI